MLRGARLAAFGRWALVAAASAGTGLLLLSALGWALDHPQHGASDALARLGWCAVPVAVTVQLAVMVARAQPGGWPRSGLAAVGLGRTGLVLLSAATAAAVCAAGSAVALLVFLQLRGDVTGVPFDGVGPELLAAGRPLPLAGAITLLALVPVASAAVRTAALRPERAPSAEAPGGLPWGVALTAVGLAVEVTAPGGHDVPLPSGLGTIPPVAVGGWIVTTVGMMLAAPGLMHVCGRALAAFRPGALRLLSGRALQQEARRLGRPLGLLCATAAAGLAAYGPLRDSDHPVGPVSQFATVLVAACVVATTALAVAESQRTRTPATGTLREMGASRVMVRSAAALRVGVLVAVLLPATMAVAALSRLG